MIEHGPEWTFDEPSPTEPPASAGTPMKVPRSFKGGWPRMLLLRLRGPEVHGSQPPKSLGFRPRGSGPVPPGSGFRIWEAKPLSLLGGCGSRGVLARFPPDGHCRQLVRTCTTQGERKRVEWHRTKSRAGLSSVMLSTTQDGAGRNRVQKAEQKERERISLEPRLESKWNQNRSPNREQDNSSPKRGKRGTTIQSNLPRTRALTRIRRKWYSQTVRNKTRER